MQKNFSLDVDVAISFRGNMNPDILALQHTTKFLLSRSWASDPEFLFEYYFPWLRKIGLNQELLDKRQITKSQYYAAQHQYRHTDYLDQD